MTNHRLVTGLTLLVVLWAFGLPSRLLAQRNGEAASSVPTVEKIDYDMRAFMAPLKLTEAEMKGRAIFAQRCANCHGGNPPRNPGPLLWHQTVDTRGEAFVREKIMKGTSAIMPGFEYSLAPAQIDSIVAFLKVAPQPRAQTGGPD